MEREGAVEVQPFPRDNATHANRVVAPLLHVSGSVKSLPSRMLTPVHYGTSVTSLWYGDDVMHVMHHASCVAVQRLGEFFSAIQDATAATELAPDWPPAWL